MGKYSKFVTPTRMERLEGYLRVKNRFPYLILKSGPTELDCPLHANDFNLVLPVEHLYWLQFALSENSGCRCSINAVTKRQYQTMQQNGVIDHRAPAILDEHGHPTGRKEKRMVPIKTVHTLPIQYELLPERDELDTLIEPITESSDNEPEGNKLTILVAIITLLPFCYIAYKMITW